MLLIFTQKQIFTGNRAKYLEKGVILATQLFANAALESEEFMRLLDWIIKMPLEFFHPTLLSVYQCIEISFSRLTRSDQENLLKFLKQILIKHSCFHQIECIFTEEFHLIPLEEENRLCSDPRDLDVWIQVERDSLEQDRFREIHEHAILGYFHCLASCFLQSYSLEQNKQMAKRFLNIPMIIPELLIEFLSGEWSPNSRTASLVLREYKLILLHSKTYLQALVLTAEMLWKDIPQEIILQVVSKIIHITHAIAILESFDKSSPIDSWNIPWNLLVPFCLTIDPQEILSCQHSGILQEKIAIELLMIHLKKCQLFSFAENSLLESQKIFEMLEWLMGIVLVRGKQISTLLHNDDSRENQVRDKNGLLVLFALELELLCHFIGISKGFPSGSLPCAWEELCKNLFAISENLKSDSELLWRFVQVQTLILSMKQSSLEAEELSRFENFIISGLESAYKPRRIATRAELAYFLLSENKNKASAWLKFSLSLLGSPEVSSINELTQAGVTPANSKLSKMFCIQTLMEILPEPSRKFAQSYSFVSLF